jgi:kynurenine formamidase
MSEKNTTSNLSMKEVLGFLHSREFVDLTHAFAPGIPHWPGFPDENRETLYFYDEGVGSVGAGIYVHRYSHVGQWGTHADPPAHFVRGLRTLDQIDPKEMVLPLVVLDIHDKVNKNPDYIVKIEDVTTWENRNGKIPEGCFVALRTDWSKRWPDDDALQNKDDQGTAHFPGWSKEVLQLLFEQRKIMACGHETTDTNCGLDCTKGDYSLETYVLSTNHYQIELLTNLDQVPEAGAMVVAAFPKPKNGSGFPARVFAILP